MPFTRIEKTRLRIIWWNQDFYFQHVKFEMLFRQPSRDVKLLVGCLNLEIRMHVEARDLESGSWQYTLGI